MQTLAYPRRHQRPRRRTPLTAFNPALPVDGSLVVAGELRDQFNGLAAEIAAISSVNAAVVDGVATLPPGDPAAVTVAVDGSTLRFAFGIPQGAPGADGAPGAAGATGPEGPAGSQGPEGPTGDEGPAGPAGIDGSNGSNGSDGAQGPPGNEGPQGPPFAQAVVDGVTTLNPGDPAWVSSYYDNSLVHFSFGIPRGQDGTNGSDGSQGPPGEVTMSELNTTYNNLIANSSANSNNVAMLNINADTDYSQTQMQEVINKLDELINALRR